MKRPTWATIVGVLAIVFGVFGILGGAQEMAIPLMLEKQKEMMESLSVGQVSSEAFASNVKIALEKDGVAKSIDMSRLYEIIDQQFKIPEWYKSWAIGMGIVSIYVAALYLISGIILLLQKPFSIDFFYCAIAMSIIWAVFQAVVYLQARESILMAQIPMSVASVVLDIILFMTVWISSRKALNGLSERAS